MVFGPTTGMASWKGSSPSAPSSRQQPLTRPIGGDPGKTPETAEPKTSGVEWQPLPGPQQRAYESAADELLYGGAAGGGKTDLLIGLAMTAHQESIIFRREYPQLKGIIRRGKKLISGCGRYNGTEHSFILPDRIVELGSVPFEDDWEKYQGRPHDLVCFDELPHFSRRLYRTLIGWLRTDDPGQRCRVVAAGNPPTTAEGLWILEEWAPWLDEKHPNPAAPGELRWYIVSGEKTVWVDGPEPVEVEGKMLYPRSRTFIPARVQDNPYYMATGYLATLMALPEPLRSQMMEGDFLAGQEDDPWQVIPTAWIKAAQERWKRTVRPDVSMSALGADVARGGRDQTTLCRRYLNWYDAIEKHPGSTTRDGQAVAALLIQAEPGNAPVNIDVIGVGASAYDFAAEVLPNVNGVNFGHASFASDKSGLLSFVNLRAEAYWLFREALDPTSGMDICLPDDPELLADLAAPRWKLTQRGILVEPKEDIKKRLGRSPDCGDVVVLASMDGGGPRARSLA